MSVSKMHTRKQHRENRNASCGQGVVVCKGAVGGLLAVWCLCVAAFAGQKALKRTKQGGLQCTAVFYNNADGVGDQVQPRARRWPKTAHPPSESTLIAMPRALRLHFIISLSV